MKHILKHKGKLYEIAEAIEESGICFTTIVFYEVEETRHEGLYNRTKKRSMFVEGYGCRSFAEVLAKRLDEIEAGECPIIEEEYPAIRNSAEQKGDTPQ